ncbi:DUF4221 family protein [Aquiflexum sp.]|uniref:DUF4221 family protein n=1 Tax=Aquiflexum sp. TaxID=1872584 RepID=UPI00359411A0
MRKLTFIFGLLVLWSCGKDGEKGTGNGSIDFTVKIDTMMVDSKGEILMAGSNLYMSDLSKDKRYLYKFDEKQYLLEMIDLENLELVRKIQFEKDGPNGLGTFLNFFTYISEDEYAFSSFMNSLIVNEKGERIWEFNFRNQKFEGEQLKEGEDLSPGYTFTKGKDEFYTRISNHPEHSNFIAKVNTTDNTVKRIEIPQFEKLKDFQIHMEMEGRGMMTLHPSIDFHPWNEDLIISNSIFNEVIIYKSKEDTVIGRNFESQLTPNGKTANFKTLVSSQEEMGAEYGKMNSQIEFGPFLFDEPNNRYYRLSHISKMNPDGEFENADVFLTIFDNDLQMIGETKINDYIKSPSSSHFAKGGAIWLHENVEDELGFIRIKILEN